MKRPIRETNLAEIVVALKPDLPLQSGVYARRLQAIARSLHRLDEDTCNYGLTDRQERRITVLENEARSIAAESGLRVYRQGDPRGWPLYLLWGDLDESTYDRGLAICPY